MFVRRKIRFSADLSLTLPLLLSVVFFRFLPPSSSKVQRVLQKIQDSPYNHVSYTHITDWM